APGKFIYGSSNGVIYEWSFGKKLNRFDIGNRISIDAVLVTKSGHWVAGGEFGVLKVSSDEGKTWSSIRGNLPFSSILDIHEWQSEIIVTSLMGNTIYISVSKENLGNWVVLQQYTMDLSDFWDVPGVRPQSFLYESRLV